MSVVSNHDVGADSKKTYVIGFVLSIVLTLIAFALVKADIDYVAPVLLALAVTQLFVQMVFFLHIRRGGKPRWNAWAFGFAAVVVAILVIGSLWIMSNLNYRMMYSPEQINQYLKEQDRL